MNVAHLYYIIRLLNENVGFSVWVERNGLEFSSKRKSFSLGVMKNSRKLTKRCL